MVIEQNQQIKKYLQSVEVVSFSDIDVAIDYDNQTVNEDPFVNYDKSFGQSGDDYILGSNNSDFVLSSGGNDIISVGGGDDAVFIEGQADEAVKINLGGVMIPSEFWIVLKVMRMFNLLVV